MENSRGTWWTTVHGVTELDTTEQLTPSERSVVLVVERPLPWELNVILYPVPTHLSYLLPVP